MRGKKFTDDSLEPFNTKLKARTKNTLEALKYIKKADGFRVLIEEAVDGYVERLSAKEKEQLKTLQAMDN